MNLSKLIKKVSKDKRIKEMGIRQYEVDLVIKVFIEILLTTLLTYGKIKIQGLFSLSIRRAKGRRIRNPQTKEIMYSSDYYKVKLEPSKKLKEGLREFKE